MLSPSVVVLFVFVCYLIGYSLYSKFLSEKIFGLRDNVSTPAHTKNDGIDYVPTPPIVLFGHHYASISGLGPILGPAVAVIWGWFPALVWVVLGTIFIGAVHDFSALVLAVRSKGYSIGSITEYLMGRRAKLLFLLIIFFLVSLAMGVFVLVLGKLFSPQGYPQVIIPSVAILLLALLIGYLTFRKKYSIKILGILAFLFVLLLVFSEHSYNLSDMLGFKEKTNADFWIYTMLAYAFAASILPVWFLLQSRDFINSLFLILGVGLLYLGFFFSDTSFMAPAIQVSPKNAPPLFPFVFVLIACGAVSGFHSLVSSGTSAKQLNQEKDARVIGYGGMIGESLLGLIAVLAVTTTFSSKEAWFASYGDYKLIGLSQKVNLFIQGGASFLESIGIPGEMALSFVALIVVSFALTSLDSGTRLLRYNIEEIGGFFRSSLQNSNNKNLFQNRYFSSAFAVGSIAFFAFFRQEGQPVGQLLWVLFGTTNQLLGALALLLASIYLFSRGRNPLYTLVPMVFLLIVSIYAMFHKAYNFISQGANISLIMISITLIVLTAWLLIESLLAAKQYKGKKISDLDIIT